MKTLEIIINNILEENNLETFNELRDDLLLKEDLGFDSLMLAHLTVIIEDETGIDIFNDGIVFTIKDVKNKLNG